jgi:hypothetical protein
MMDEKQSLETLSAGSQTESGHSSKLMCLLVSQQSLEGNFSLIGVWKIFWKLFPGCCMIPQSQEILTVFKVHFWLILQRPLSAGKLQGR